ncbi:hypothetical protein B4N89_36895 [Embleya scabrispora]|uniref:Uncharacterized protein n=1 Tax=Embleya scabrispora TaxID=159449 RepID=A0A1T3NNX2_9ACTN|nr:DUF6461 domain-containing protein [Embleya scabrispora]OPC78458.1 hypothetical protein B4N89_36895 [Embleya scabrispora]
MGATGSEYVWFEELFPDLAEACCLTLVEGLDPDEVLRRLGGSEAPSLTGATAITEAAFAMPEESDGRRQLLAMAQLGSWTLVVEPNGYLGVTEDRALPASAGTRWISHFVNINGVDAWVWAEDGDLRLAFEPTLPESRRGSDPDGYVDAMRAAGFDFAPDPPDDYVPARACFAFAEHLTGVVLTAGVFERTAFRCGSAPIRMPPTVTSTGAGSR